MRFKCDVWRLLYNFLRLKECKMIDKYPGRVYIGIKPTYTPPGYCYARRNSAYVREYEKNK